MDEAFGSQGPIARDGMTMSEERETPCVFVANALVGPLLNDAEIARTFAELILRRLYGDAEVRRQKPLKVTDRGTDWVVAGSYQEPDQLPGAWTIRVRKSDCRVEELGHYMRREIPDEIKSFFPSDTRPG